MKPADDGAEQQKPSEARFSRRVHVTDPDAAFEELQRENDSLMEHIASLEARVPSSEEIAYIRNRMLAEQRAAWAWKMVRTYTPWVIGVCSVVGSATYGFVTWFVHTFQLKT